MYVCMYILSLSYLEQGIKANLKSFVAPMHPIHRQIYIHIHIYIHTYITIKVMNF